VSWLSNKCGSLDVSLPHGPLQPVTGIVLHLYYGWLTLVVLCVAEIQWKRLVLVKNEWGFGSRSSRGRMVKALLGTWHDHCADSFWFLHMYCILLNVNYYLLSCIILVSNQTSCYTRLWSMGTKGYHSAEVEVWECIHRPRNPQRLVQPEGLGKLKEIHIPHRVSNIRSSGL
jgi:hypothetical protein